MYYLFAINQIYSLQETVQYTRATFRGTGTDKFDEMLLYLNGSEPIRFRVRFIEILRVRFNSEMSCGRRRGRGVRVFCVDRQYISFHFQRIFFLARVYRI